MNTLLSTRILIACLQLRGVGRGLARYLAESATYSVNEPDELVAMLDDARAAQSRVPHVTVTAARDAIVRADEILDESSGTGITALAINSKAYPARLRRISDAPVVLYVRGNKDALHARHAVAVIGTRDPTAYGEAVARRIGKHLARRRVTVVSGLALGCDARAHEGCVEADGLAVAVLAHGLHIISPKRNAPLGEEIIARGGCLVSEYEIGVAAQRTMFVERDRIQSGLADAVLVIETDIEGGTMHTVKFCREQERLLACVAHPPKWLDAPSTRGNQKLLAEGAMSIANATDVDSLVDAIHGDRATVPSAIQKKAGQLDFTWEDTLDGGTV